MAEVVAPIIANSVAGAAELAVLEGEVVGVQTMLLAEEAAMAAALAEEGVLLGEEAVEAAAGPFGWIPMLITAGVAVAVAISIAAMQRNIANMQKALGEKRIKIDSIKAQPPLLPSGPGGVVPDLVVPGIHEVLASIPNGPVVDNFMLYDCTYDFSYSRCRRRLNY